MNREQRILSAIISSRGMYHSVQASLEQDDFTDEGWIIASAIISYYNNDEGIDHVNKDWLKDNLATQYPRNKDTFCGIVELLTEVSVPNVLEEYRLLKRAAAGSRLAEALVSNSSSVDEYLDQYVRCDESNEEQEEGNFYVDADLEEVLSAVRPENLISIIPSSLNEKLGGGLQPGNQVAIYAPTEVGKSLLAINIAAGICHSGRKVLYCGNEDPAKSMLLRFYARMAGMDKAAILAQPARAKERAVSNGFSNLVFYEMQPGTVAEVQRAVNKYTPEVVFIDQMANMLTPSAFSKTEKNEWLSVKFREMAKRNNLVTVLVHQASGDAYGKLILDKNDMYYSNVGVQGQMDVMIGIGMDDAYENNGMRMLTLTKNKLTGNHDSIPVAVNTDLSKVIKLGE